MKSVNEIDKFDYRDCVIDDANVSKDMELLLSALIVKANNSQNSNYTDSYAGQTKAAFEGATIDKITKVGYRVYDARDELIEDIPDSIVYGDGVDRLESAIEGDIGMKTKILLTGAYLTAITEQGEGKYILSIEIPDEDPSAITDEYDIEISCTDVIMSWDKYLNRVQNM